MEREVWGNLNSYSRATISHTLLQNNFLILAEVRAVFSNGHGEKSKEQQDEGHSFSVDSLLLNSIQNQGFRALGQRLRAHTALAEDLGLVPHTQEV